MAPTYHIITFAPIQDFITKSRKLRDLYGSSYILSFLSWIICLAAKNQGCEIISPARINVTQGMPNQIVLRGELSADQISIIEQTFNQAWTCLVNSCREWIEKHIQTSQDSQGNTIKWDYNFWKRDWQLWANYSWEFFHASGKPGESITQARQKLNQVKYARNWTGINWQGESSTLSGSDAIAYPLLGHNLNSRHDNYQPQKQAVRSFYHSLSQLLGESFIDPREELSIPELTKRLITHEEIRNSLIEHLNQLNLVNLEADAIQQLKQDLNPDSFGELNRHNPTENYWTGWFQGDGDNAGKYFQKLAQLDARLEQEQLTQFSTKMRDWGKQLYEKQEEYLPPKGRIIYAGGDDFFGVLYHPYKQISPRRCLDWLAGFKSQIWHHPEPKEITPSVGFVWAGSQVPQRDILQHCHLAEQAAKKTGRDRIAFRILFNSGNYMEWVCPWWLLDTQELTSLLPRFSLSLQQQKPGRDRDTLKNLINSYQDREQGDNWTHFYQDIATLQSRHAFNNQTIDIALALIEIYFGSDWKTIFANPQNWWNLYDEYELPTFTGILGDPKQFNPNYQENPSMREALNSDPKVIDTFNQWLINLANLGFYLTDDHESISKPKIPVSHPD
ncbi:MAG: Cas10/Cmr2 second palm domain-containing protein [Coleofasciculus sp.]|uniref:Cas10/Cmr2 second palm domain-containing protein n=1 Tax=Coleofasciculus sp. TaxID=3100458 RepID=UPI003A165E56